MKTPKLSQTASTASAPPTCSLVSFVLPHGVEYEDLQKVSVTKGKATHVASPWVEGFTLCGLRWWFDVQLGGDHYCQRCQAKLSKIKKANAA